MPIKSVMVAIFITTNKHFNNAFDTFNNNNNNNNNNKNNNNNNNNMLLFFSKNESMFRHAYHSLQKCTKKFLEILRNFKRNS